MQSRPLPEDAVQLFRGHGGDLAGIQPADPLLELVRSAEGVFHADLLVEHHADQKRQRVAVEEPVRLLVLSPRDWHASSKILV